MKQSDPKVLYYIVELYNDILSLKSFRSLILLVIKTHPKINITVKGMRILFEN